MKKIILIKLGGSFITEKDKPLTAREDYIKSIAHEISNISKSNQDSQFIIGNGAGSFGHYLVKKYNIKEGVTSPEQVIGFCEVQNAVAHLNRLVVEALLAVNVPACTVQPSAILIAKNATKKELFLDPVHMMCEKGIVPVLYGDIILDTKKGCCIFSTEDLFYLLIQSKLPVSRVIHISQVDGVLDRDQQVISHITKDNWPEVQKYIYAPKGFDVTGGMKHKIETALEYAKKGVQTHIINGTKAHTLKRLLEKQAVGTTIS